MGLRWRPRVPTRPWLAGALLVIVLCTTTPWVVWLLGGFGHADPREANILLWGQPLLLMACSVLAIYLPPTSWPEPRTALPLVVVWYAIALILEVVLSIASHIAYFGSQL